MLYLRSNICCHVFTQEVCLLSKRERARDTVRRIRRVALHTLEQMRVFERLVCGSFPTIAFFPSVSENTVNNGKDTAGSPVIYAAAAAELWRQTRGRLVQSAHAQIGDWPDIHYKKFNFKECCCNNASGVLATKLCTNYIQK